MIKIVRLSSGIRLVMEKMDAVRSACVGIWCNTGSANELPDEYGITHFIEHMLFKGTKNRSTFEIANEIDRIGGDINAFTGKETTCYYVKCLDEHIYTSCDVLVDMIENPLFDNEEMNREKLVVIEEINMNADDPDDVSMDLLEENLFGGSNLSHPILGTKETVMSFNHDKLSKYYNEHYTKDSIVVSVAGSFDEDKIIEYFERHFHELGDVQRLDDKGAPNSGGCVKTVYKDIEQAHLAMGIRTVNALDDRRYSLSLLNTLMGGGMSSRLFQNVREKKGLAYSVYSLTGTYDVTGAFVICAGIAKNRIDEALEAIELELDNLNNSSISEEEFNSAKEQVKSSYIFSQENVKSRMRTNGRNLISLGKCPMQEDILEIIDNITIDEVEEVKSMICDYSSYTIINVTGQ